MRKHNSCPVYKQTRRHKVSNPVLSGVEVVDLSNRKQHGFESSPSGRSPKHFSGSFVQNENSPIRMVPEPLGSFQDFLGMGEPMIDLFASADSHKVPIFCSWILDHRAYAIDALTISWEEMFAYVYAPICVIPKVLQHMQKFNCQIILIAPQWPCRHWYTNLLQMSVESPMKLPIRSDLLSQPKTKIFHPNPEVFSLSAWLPGRCLRASIPNEQQKEDYPPAILSSKAL